MGEITKYFGYETMKLFLDNASKDIKNFQSQTPKTKLALVDDLYAKNEIYKQAVSELVETLDEVEADRNLKDMIIKKIKNDLGIKNEDYIRKYQLSVVMTEDKKHARKALICHIHNKYKT